MSVVLPTIGRAELVRACLASLVLCEPRADEILVVDSSTDDTVAHIVASFSHVGAHVIPFEKSGLGHAFNEGLRRAKHETVLLTNDDCIVDPSWVRVGAGLAVQPDVIVTGRVLPDGDPDVVPSTIVDQLQHDYQGRSGFFLFTQCMALDRNSVLEFGAFDGRISPSAEDNDLSYRWLRAGRTIRYEPDFVVWHRDWRSPEQLERLYIDYGVGQGVVYAKHLLDRDLRIGRFLARDAYAVARGLVDRVLRGPRPHGDWRVGLARGLPVGLLKGWRLYSDARSEDESE
ncbi:MAG: glycosyltransferase family 2 protein [Gaiellaceae bacterium]